MERTCTIIKPSGHKLAELTFHYDWHDRAEVTVQEFRQLYDDGDPDDESKSVYESHRYELHQQPRQFDSIEAIKAFDHDFAGRELYLRHDYPLATCRFEYPADPVLLRYIASHPRKLIGVCDIRFSFPDNLKQVAFRSAEHPRFDMDLTADSLTTNLGCLGRIELYGEPIITSGVDLARLEPWY